MSTVKIGKRVYKHADSWKELTVNEFRMVARFFEKKELTIADRTHIANYLLGIKPKDMLINLPDKVLALHDFLFEDGTCDRWFIRIRDLIFTKRGFGDMLMGVSFGRWVFVDSYFIKYETGKEVDDLLKFIAAIYIKNPNQEMILKQYGRYRYLTPDEIRDIVFNYKLIKRWIQKKYPSLFPSAAKGPKTGPNWGPKKQPYTMWIDIFDKMVGDDIIHSDEYAALPVLRVFKILNDRIRENAK